MYSVAFERTVALLSFWCGVATSLSKSRFWEDRDISRLRLEDGATGELLDEPDLAFDNEAASAAMRREGTESRRAVILSLRLVR